MTLCEKMRNDIEEARKNAQYFAILGDWNMEHFWLSAEYGFRIRLENTSIEDLARKI